MSSPRSTCTKSYLYRSTHTHHTALGRELLRIMHTKQTNLCLSIDLTDPERVLEIADGMECDIYTYIRGKRGGRGFIALDFPFPSFFPTPPPSSSQASATTCTKLTPQALGPYICLLKTHIDIIDFPASSLPLTTFLSQLTALATSHTFLLFEDRKFADIGSTTALQYSAGLYRISSWAHIVNAHALPGRGILQGLQSAVPEALCDQRACLLLYEMSSEGHLFSEGYKNSVLGMARENRGFVMGFVAQGGVSGECQGRQGQRESKDGEDTEPQQKSQEDWIIMTPGVNISSKGDSLGQQYNTPEHVVGKRGADVMIVGRGIYGHAGEGVEKMQAVAEEYRRRGWAAYQERLTPGGGVTGDASTSSSASVASRNDITKTTTG